MHSKDHQGHFISLYHIVSCFLDLVAFLSMLGYIFSLCKAFWPMSKSVKHLGFLVDSQATAFVLSNNKRSKFLDPYYGCTSGEHGFIAEVCRKGYLPIHCSSRCKAVCVRGYSLHFNGWVCWHWFCLCLRKTNKWKHHVMMNWKWLSCVQLSHEGPQ